MFDAKKFLVDEFGRPAYIPTLLSAYRLQAPEPEAVEKWSRRNSIPGRWLAVLIVVLELENGHPISLQPYVGSYAE